MGTGQCTTSVYSPSNLFCFIMFIVKLDLVGLGHEYCAQRGAKLCNLIKYKVIAIVKMQGSVMLTGC